MPELAQISPVILPLEVAKAMTAKAMTKVEEIGVPYTLTVVDGSGNLVLSTRMDGAALASIETSLAKARTAVYFGAATKDLSGAVADRAPLATIQTSMPTHLAFVAGAVPIRDAAGIVVGAFGAGGATPEQDHEVAAFAVSAEAGGDIMASSTDLVRPELVNGFTHIAHSDQGGRPDAMQIQYWRDHVFVGHLFSGGFSVIDMSDLKNPGSTTFVPAPKNTWNIHLQAADDLLLVIHAKDLWLASDADEDGAIVELCGFRVRLPCIGPPGLQQIAFARHTSSTCGTTWCAAGIAAIRPKSRDHAPTVNPNG